MLLTLKGMGKGKYQLPVNHSLPDLRGYAGRFDRDGVTTGKLIRKPKICISNLGFYICINKILIIKENLGYGNKNY